jgi:hypothetical protein
MVWLSAARLPKAATLVARVVDILTWACDHAGDTLRHLGEVIDYANV